MIPRPKFSVGDSVTWSVYEQYYGELDDDHRTPGKSVYGPDKNLWRIMKVIPSGEEFKYLICNVEEPPVVEPFAIVSENSLYLAPMRSWDSDSI